VVVLSYSLDSMYIDGAKWFDVQAPIIVMEHALLGVLGMANDHKWAEPAPSITIANSDSPLAAGFPKGDLPIYKPNIGKTEVFWGVPSDSALKIATVKGAPTHWVIFAYPAGAMMMSKPAPGKRLQYFLGAHLVPTMFLNEAGLKLLDAAIDWCIQ
jgi:hypothetical protein